MVFCLFKNKIQKRSFYRFFVTIKNLSLKRFEGFFYWWHTFSVNYVKESNFKIKGSNIEFIKILFIFYFGFIAI